MTLPVQKAEQILRARLGEPAKQATNYVIGFVPRFGKALAMHREATETRLWFEPPSPPKLDGVRLMGAPSNGNSNLNGPLFPLRALTTLRVEVDTVDGLHRFLDWYVGSGADSSGRSVALPSASEFQGVFRRFQQLTLAKSGHPFETFQDGLIGAWEEYKPRLRNFARGILCSETWDERDIGSGLILQRVINAIEIQDSTRNLTNNLVFWQNRFGHANRDHHILLEAVSESRLGREIESLLFDLYRDRGNEGDVFDTLSVHTGRKYPLLAYLYFLKDIDRFLPIQPTGFDLAFKSLGINFGTRGQCGWENYSEYNKVIDGLRPLIAEAARLPAVSLIDAHSFCWVLSTLLKQESSGAITEAAGAEGRILGKREVSIFEMIQTVLNTVRNSNGQMVSRTVKNKDLRMNELQLEKLLASLLDLQGNRCALTGIPLQYHGSVYNKDLRPSVDRIDSEGHYEAGNIQVVCQFINKWKSNSDNEAFKELLTLVRNVDDARTDP